jgi:hypothetical protein
MDRTPMSDDAAAGVGFVLVMLLVAVTHGVWLLAIPSALVLALVVLALL